MQTGGRPQGRAALARRLAAAEEKLAEMHCIAASTPSSAAELSAGEMHRARAAMAAFEAHLAAFEAQMLAILVGSDDDE